MRYLFAVIIITFCATLSFAQVTSTSTDAVHVTWNFSTEATKPGWVINPPDFEIVSFDLSFKSKTSDLVGPYSSNCERFTKDQMKLWQRCRPGDKFFFENIKVKDKKTGVVLHANSFAKELK